MNLKTMEFLAYVAYSHIGEPAPYFGIHFTQRELREEFKKQTGRDMADSAYIPTKVRVTVEP